jgi:GrpB-like predicted nucleotidyltransferase (UPF0157 family)
MADETTALGLVEGELTLTSHDETWAEAFLIEAKRIKEAVSGIALTIDHVGSTSVPGLPAKPILDLALSAARDDECKIASSLASLGYADLGIRSGRLFVRRDATGARTHNLHLYQVGDPLLRDQIAFRDSLRSNTDLRAAYAALKQALVTRLGNAGRAQYADAKSNFIKAALDRPGRIADG